jgi:hypothetical protein
MLRLPLTISVTRLAGTPSFSANALAESFRARISSARIVSGWTRIMISLGKQPYIRGRPPCCPKSLPFAAEWNKNKTRTQSL